MKKKYEFTGETKTITTGKKNVILHRIQAVTDFGVIKAGHLGGWIEEEENLSHDGSAWVCGNAVVHGSAEVYDSAIVCDNAVVCNNAKVGGNARVYGSAEVYDSAIVCDNAVVCNNAKVCGNAKVYDSAEICGNAVVGGNAKVYGSAEVYDSATICAENHVMTVTNVGSRNDTTTFYRGGDKIMVKCGCFNGTLNEFFNKVEKTHGNSNHADVYKTVAVAARLQIDLSGLQIDLSGR